MLLIVLAWLGAVFAVIGVVCVWRNAFFYASLAYLLAGLLTGACVLQLGSPLGWVVGILSVMAAGFFLLLHFQSAPTLRGRRSGLTIRRRPILD